MRVPKREDQSLFISPLIVRQLSSQSIVLDQVQLSYEYYTRSVGFVNPFYKFFFKMEEEGIEPSSSLVPTCGFPRIDYQIHPR